METAPQATHARQMDSFKRMSRSLIGAIESARQAAATILAGREG